MWTTIVQSIFGEVVSFFSRRQEIKHAEHEQHLKRIVSGEVEAGKSDQISLASRGWKDEYLLIVTTLPMIVCFVPDMGPYVQQGFDTLSSSVPEYYWWGLGMVYVDTFGFRQMIRGSIEHFLKKRIK